MHYTTTCGPGSVAGIATGYRLNGSGNQSRWGRDFPHLSRPALGPPSLLYSGYRVFPGGKERPGRDADPSPLLVPWSRKGRTPPWAVRPVQSLSARKKVHSTLPFLYYCLIMATQNSWKHVEISRIYYFLSSRVFVNIKSESTAST